jgi:hypothetical protein
MLMCRFRWYKFSLVWSLWLACLALATAPVCLAHAAAQEHDGTHPPLCIDTSSPIAQSDGRPILLTQGGTFPFHSKSLSPGVSSAAISVQLPFGLSLSARLLFHIYEHRLDNPSRMFPVVLRL